MQRRKLRSLKSSLSGFIGAQADIDSQNAAVGMTCQSPDASEYLSQCFDLDVLRHVNVERAFDLGLNQFLCHGHTYLSGE